MPDGGRSQGSEVHKYRPNTLLRGDYFMALVDWLGSLLAWFLFFIYRKSVELPGIALSQSVSDRRLYLGLLVIPLVWMALWWLLGSYESVYRKSRIKSMYMTTAGVVIGSLGLLLTVIQDDLTLTMATYMHSFMVVLVIHWLCFVIFRLIYLTFTKRLLTTSRVGFTATVITEEFIADVAPVTHTHVVKTIDPGSIYQELAHGETDNLVLDISDADTINKVTPLIIGKAGNRGAYISEASFGLLDYDYHAVPSLRDSYMTLRTAPIDAWQRNLKRVVDVSVAAFFLLLLSPLMLWLAYRVRASSKGGWLFTQERLGRHGLPFRIYKFRSMYPDAELDGPALATDDDDRCTPFGKWMRRWRLDELPQFLNVLNGDMSLVGPRPERKYYADQLVAHNPRYALLWQVKPGITSWGQIRYGYASDVQEMLKRFRYDLLYIEHMSMILDFRILYYTLSVLWEGRGR